MSTTKFEDTFQKALAQASSRRSRQGIRCPLADKLTAAFKISRSDANSIRLLCKKADEPEALEKLISSKHPKTASYVRRMHSSPYGSAMWRRTVVLHAINSILDGFGVEALDRNLGGPRAPAYEYINMGDTYATTLIYKRSSDNLFIGSWGDIAEREFSSRNDY